MIQYTQLPRKKQAGSEDRQPFRMLLHPRASHSRNGNIGQKSNTRISPKALPSTAVCIKCMGDVHTSVGFSWPLTG